ncbi:MAG: S-layer homology domain-containing protein [Firmicutes bacterium]|nr:S-layer homology domain-containing protein [Bacillota bacterium]
MIRTNAGLYAAGFAAALLAIVLSAPRLAAAAPPAPLTRGGFAAVLLAAIGEKTVPLPLGPPKTAVSFSDVSEGDADYGAITAAAAKGYVSGYPDGSFRPDAPVAFEDMVCVASNALRIQPVCDAEEILARYADGKSVSQYARAYLAENVVRGYIETAGDRLGPRRTVGKAEAEAYLAKVLSENIAFGLDIPDGTEQLVAVTAAGYGVSAGRAHLYEIGKNGVWQNMRNFGCFIGQDGFSDEKLLEGRRNTPVGLFAVGTAFGAADNPGTKLAYRKIAKDDVWVDDPKSALYNTWQKRGDNNGRWSSAENMDVAAYSLGFVIGYNSERTPYAGSAYFFHIYGKPTYGCVGAAREDVLETLLWLDAGKKPMILMCPDTDIPARYTGVRKH